MIARKGLGVTSNRWGKEMRHQHEDDRGERAYRILTIILSAAVFVLIVMLNARGG